MLTAIARVPPTILEAIAAATLDCRDGDISGDIAIVAFTPGRRRQEK